MPLPAKILPRVLINERDDLLKEVTDVRLVADRSALVRDQGVTRLRVENIGVARVGGARDGLKGMEKLHKPNSAVGVGLHIPSISPFRRCHEELALPPLLPLPLLTDKERCVTLVSEKRPYDTLGADRL